jgi:hypothetical protein
MVKHVIENPFMFEEWPKLWVKLKEEGWTKFCYPIQSSDEPSRLTYYSLSFIKESDLVSGVHKFASKRLLMQYISK